MYSFKKVKRFTAKNDLKLNQEFSTKTIGSFGDNEGVAVKFSRAYKTARGDKIARR